MRVVVIGAYGLIGSYVVARLLAEGHDLVGVGRDIAMARRRFPRVSWALADLAATSVADWAALLRAADAVVNCAGALQDSGRDDLQAVHVTGVERLLQSCAADGVRRFIQISAAGVGAGRTTEFNRTKLAAETMLAATDLDWVILRPGLVLAPAAYGGTALLRGLAAFPWIVPVACPDSIVQVVSALDVAAAVAKLLSTPEIRRVSIDLVHADAWRFDALVLELRRWLGLPPARAVRVPAALLRSATYAADALAAFGWRSPMRRAAFEQLRQGVRGDGAAAERVLGLRLQSLPEMLEAWPSGVQERWFARCYFLKPALLTTLGAFWFLSGLIGLVFRFPEAVQVLTSAGILPLPAEAAVAAGGLADMAAAGAIVFRRSAGPALRAMLLLSLAYLVGGTLLRPDLWLDPLGSFLKTIPAGLLAVAALAILDER
jgi:uncharacterized protein YbjT (DUF2867 family)